jgi:CheY-like chemotaxis protein
MERGHAGVKILVAEPNEGERKALSHALSAKGDRVIAVASVREALDRAAGDRPDLAVIHAPDQSFASVCGAPAFRSVPVVAVSSDYCDRAIASEAGCALCISSPPGRRGLSSQIGALLDKRAHEPAGRASAGTA